MKFTLVFFFICLYVFSFHSSQGQEKDSTLTGTTVRGRHKISNDTRINDFSPGQKVQVIDSATLQQYQLQNMANLLSQQLPVFIKSYGFNGIATLNFRGSSAAQTIVTWNGVPIQNAALGMADVSTLPVVFVNKVNIAYGGSSAMLGSGNVGGALLLENDPPVFDSGKKTLSLSAGAGSFGQFMGGLKGSIAGRRWYFAATAFAQNAANNFSFTDATGTERQMPNGALQSKAVMAQAAYKPGQYHVVSLSAWLQDYYRQIPPALFEPASAKEQTSNSLRLLADWHRNKNGSMWFAKSALIRDDMRYTDNAVLLQSDNTSYQYYQDIGWRKRIGTDSRILLFSPVQLLWMAVPVTGIVKNQGRIALAGAYNYKHFNDRLDAAVNIRAEKINSQSFVLPGASAAFALTDWFSVRANVQRSYRAPTLNELYYYPGGDSTLKPEQGWSQDAGYTIKAKPGHFSFYHDASVFNRNIRDWIIWLGGAIWTPHNIAEVHSRGIETDNKLTYQSGNWRFHIGVNTSYVLATVSAAYIQNDGSEGKQIPYTPRYNGRATAGIGFKQLAFTYIHSYTGYRFITSDESEYLLPYQSGNLQIMYHTSFRSHTLQFSGQCNNIWNEQYTVVGYRPMPGINWLVGLKAAIF